MFKIIDKKELAEGIAQFDIEAPLIAKKAIAGQFVVIRVREDGERVPLTIAAYDREKGTLMLVAMKVGKSTALLAELKKGDSILDVVGPLGNASEIEDFGRVIFFCVSSKEDRGFAYCPAIRPIRMIGFCNPCTSTKLI